VDEKCPFTEACKILGKPWRLVIVYKLLDGPKSYGDLMWNLRGISSKTLSSALRELERMGLVSKKREGKRSLYQLTKMGEELAPVLKSFYQWAEKWLK